MSSATASGADAGGGSARYREHNQGNQERKATSEQIAAVVRIRSCKATAFYDILGLESVRATCSESDIKKAYRKQSLLTHPDKNGHEHADEAFKMVARAFSILGDKDKRSKYDKFGGDPDSRFGAGGAGPSGGHPFAGFARRAPSGAGGFGPNMWEEELSPEELFNRFFGGGGGFGGPFGGPQFVFNMNGGPGFRVHTFDGARPRTRPRNPGQPEPERAFFDMFIQLLPLIILFILPVITNLFGTIINPDNTGTTSARNIPEMKFDEPDYEAGFTEQRTMDGIGVSYYVREQDIEHHSAKELLNLDRRVENKYTNDLLTQCTLEKKKRDDMIKQASGWFVDDEEKMAVAVSHQTPACVRYEQLTSRSRRT